MAKVAHGSVRSGWNVAMPIRIAPTPMAGAMTRIHSAPVPSGSTRYTEREGASEHDERTGAARQGV